MVAKKDKHDLVLVTGASDAYGWLAHLTEPSKTQWCDRWKVGYHRHLFPTPHTCRDKLALWRYCLDRWPAIFWLGADTIITNQRVNPRSLTSVRADLVIARDVHGIQTDSFVMHSTRHTKAAIDWAMVHCNEYLNEQYALSAGLYRCGVNVKIVHPSKLNAYPKCSYYCDRASYMEKFSPYSWKPGDFVMHLPAVPQAERFRMFGKYLMEVVK